MESSNGSRKRGVIVSGDLVLDMLHRCPIEPFGFSCRVRLPIPHWAFDDRLFHRPQFYSPLFVREARTGDKPPGMRWPIAVIAAPIGVPTWAAVLIDPMSDPSGAGRWLGCSSRDELERRRQARPATRASAKTITASAIDIESLSPASRVSLSFPRSKWNPRSSPYYPKEKHKEACTVVRRRQREAARSSVLRPKTAPASVPPLRGPYAALIANSGRQAIDLSAILRNG